MDDDDRTGPPATTGNPVALSTRRTSAELTPKSRPYAERPPPEESPLVRRAGEAIDAYEGHMWRQLPAAVVLGSMAAGSLAGFLVGDILLGVPFSYLGIPAGLLGGAALSLFLLTRRGLDR